MPSTRSTPRGGSPALSIQPSSRAVSAAPEDSRGNGTPVERVDTEIVLSETLNVGEVFPFFLLAFAALGAGFLLTATSAPLVKQDWTQVPVLIAGISMMLLSPLIGYSLSLGVWKVTGKIGYKLLAFGIGFVFIAALVHQTLELRDLAKEVQDLKNQVWDIQNEKHENPLKKLGINW